MSIGTWVEQNPFKIIGICMLLFSILYSYGVIWKYNKHSQHVKDIEKKKKSKKSV